MKNKILIVLVCSILFTIGMKGTMYFEGILNILDNSDKMMLIKTGHLFSLVFSGISFGIIAKLIFPRTKKGDVNTVSSIVMSSCLLFIYISFHEYQGNYMWALYLVLILFIALGLIIIEEVVFKKSLKISSLELEEIQMQREFYDGKISSLVCDANTSYEEQKSNLSKMKSFVSQGIVEIEQRMKPSQQSISIVLILKLKLHYFEMLIDKIDSEIENRLELINKMEAVYLLYVSNPKKELNINIENFLINLPEIMKGRTLSITSGVKARCDKVVEFEESKIKKPLSELDIHSFIDWVFSDSPELKEDLFQKQEFDGEGFEYSDKDLLSDIFKKELEVNPSIKLN